VRCSYFLYLLRIFELEAELIRQRGAISNLETSLRIAEGNLADALVSDSDEYLL
jgi:hypothetical protein